MLCQPCMNVLQGRGQIQLNSTPTYVFFGHHHSIESLERSVLNGCTICEPFWSFIPIHVQAFLRSAKNISSGADFYVTWLLRFDRDVSLPGDCTFRPIFNHAFKSIPRFTVDGYFLRGSHMLRSIPSTWALLLGGL